VSFCSLLFYLQKHYERVPFSLGDIRPCLKFNVAARLRFPKPQCLVHIILV
ncbi:hypothetical protein BDF14DRAFT_1822339, partial [Spinellus fusiger]